jgi:hypothetical protein
MTDWKLTYQQLMSDFKGERLIPHLAILGGGIVLGILLGIYFGNNLNLSLLVWIAAALIDYLIYGREILEIFTKKKPYFITGIIHNKVKKVVVDRREEIEEYWFDIEVREAYTLARYALSEHHYYEKEGMQGIQVPESMFLSLQRGEEVSLVCEPDDYAWGIMKGEDVIRIDA